MEQRYASPTSSSGGQPIALSWQHPAGLIGLSFINLLLRIVTLGVYGFWAKAEVRKRIWSAVRIEGEPLHYTGTGKELFLGFIAAFLIVLVPLIASAVAVFVTFGPDSVIANLYKVAVYILLFYLIGFAVYRAQRYRLSRTQWRAIRGSLVGSAASYAWTYFWTGLLAVLSLGWALPWRSTKLQGIMTRDMRFGGEPFRFDAKSGPLYAKFAVVWIAGIVVFAAVGLVIAGVLGVFDPASQLGGESSPFEIGPEGQKLPKLSTIAIIYGAFLLGMLVLSIFNAWYRASQMRHFFEHTHFDGATLRSTITTPGLIWIGVTNILLVAVTLGILAPVAYARITRYIVENTRIEGTVRLAEIEQGAEQNIRRGEGLAQAFDVDAF
jgi:uncharacterized membrane protein YjgN (DUF898 family)